MATKQCLHTFTDHSDQVSALCRSCLSLKTHVDDDAGVDDVYDDDLQVWSVKYNKEGNQVVSVSDDKSVNIYSIPV